MSQFSFRFMIFRFLSLDLEAQARSRQFSKVTLRTSLTVVSPARTLRMPLSRKVSIPCLRASFFKSLRACRS